MNMHFNLNIRKLTPYACPILGGAVGWWWNRGSGSIGGNIDGSIDGILAGTCISIMLVSLPVRSFFNPSPPPRSQLSTQQSDILRSALWSIGMTGFTVLGLQWGPMGSVAGLLAGLGILRSINFLNASPIF